MRGAVLRAAAHCAAAMRVLYSTPLLNSASSTLFLGVVGWYAEKWRSGGHSVWHELKYKHEFHPCSVHVHWTFGAIEESRTWKIARGEELGQ